jgi:RNA polymerase sigma-70 factor (ECF subfamily)
MSDESQTNDTNPAVPVTAGSFDAFVGPHLAVLLRVAGSLCRNPHDSEDLVQDTLIRAFNGLDGFDGTYPRAWLLIIMRNARLTRHPDFRSEHR